MSDKYNRYAEAYFVGRPNRWGTPLRDQTLTMLSPPPLLYIHHNYDGAHDDDDDDDAGPSFISIMIMMLPIMTMMKMLDLPLYLHSHLL